MIDLVQHSIAVILANQHPGGAYIASPEILCKVEDWEFSLLCRFAFPSPAISRQRALNLIDVPFTMRSVSGQNLVQRHRTVLGMKPLALPGGFRQ